MLLARDSPLNEARNLVVKSPDYYLFVETEDGVTSSYVQVGLKQLGTCTWSDNGGQVAVDKREEMLNMVGISRNQLIEKRKRIASGFVVYRLEDKEIGTGCLVGSSSYIVLVRYP